MGPLTRAICSQPPPRLLSYAAAYTDVPNFQLGVFITKEVKSDGKGVLEALERDGRDARGNA